MRCECCKRDDKYDIMYRTLSDKVLCWYCSEAQSMCCYNRSVLPTKWFRVTAKEM